LHSGKIIRGNTVKKHREHRSYFEDYYIKTPFYKALTRERTISEVDDLNKLCRFSQNDKILDLGCGQGRHCLDLVKRGYDTTGLDYSRTLIAEACRNATRNNYPLQFIRSDMLFLPLRKNSFSWVLSLFGSCGYFSDDENLEVLRGIFRIIRPGGSFLLDCWNKEYALQSNGNEKKYEIDDGGYLINKSSYSRKTKRMTVIRKFVNKDDIRELKISCRLYSPEELVDNLKSAGFGNLRIFSDYRGKAFAADSRAIVILCRKPN